MINRDRSIDHIRGFLFGGLVGAAVGLLLAPQSGQETRAMIRETGLKFKEQTGQSMEQAWNQFDAAVADLSQRVDSLQERVKELKIQGRAQFEEQTEMAQQAAEKVKEQVKEVA